MRHSICSICYTEADGCLECPAEGCTGDLPQTVLKTFVNKQLTDTIRAMKLPVQCRNRKNGCPEKGEEKEVEEHEIECEFRIVNPKWWGGPKIFKDLLSVFSKTTEKRNGKWKLYSSNDNGKTYTRALRNYMDPDGHLFLTVLDIPEKRSLVMAYATVIGGQRVANKYRVELRLNSSEKEFTNTHHGPLLTIDVREPRNHEEVYRIDKKIFASFNKGFEYFGNHNKDKNGEIIVPITVKIIKKELDIPKG